MNIPLKDTIIDNIKLETPDDYLLVYVSHQLNYNEHFNKQSYDFNFIVNNFLLLYKQNTNDFIFINNVITIILNTLKTDNKNNSNEVNTTTIDIKDIIDILIIIFNNKDHHSIIFKLLFELLNPLIDNILLSIFHYFFKHHDKYDIILSKINILLHSLGSIYVENYLYNKVNVYQYYSLNNLHLEKTILNDYKCLLMMLYIVSYYVNSKQLCYFEVHTNREIVSVTNNEIKISIYDKKNLKIYHERCEDSNVKSDDDDDDDYDNDEITDLLDTTYNGIMYTYSLYLCNFILQPLHYKCIQLKEDISLINRTVSDLSTRYIYNYNQLFVHTLGIKKNKIEHIHNYFYFFIHNDYLHKNIILLYNNLYKSCLCNRVKVNLKTLETSISFIKLFYNHKIQLNNICNLEYILLGFFHIVRDNELEVNIYNKCIIIDILSLNKNTIVHYLINKKTHYIPLFLQSIVNIYKKIEMNKTYDKEEKHLLRYNIHTIMNQLLLNNNVKCIDNIYQTINMPDILFLLFQDVNYYFEYILTYIKLRSVYINNTNRTALVKKYCSYFKEGILLLEKCIVYDKNIIYNQNIAQLMISNFNTYLDKILNDPVHYIYFNFNNINIYFSWKIDLLEKINNIYGVYKTDIIFCTLFLSDGSNYNKNVLKQIELFIDEINENNNNNIIKSDIDILIETITFKKKSYDYNVDIDNPISDIHSKVPSKFIDPIVMCFIKNPIILPDSKMIVDKTMIFNHLLLSDTDPFCNTYLNKELLLEHNKTTINIEKIDIFTKEFNKYMDSVKKNIDNEQKDLVEMEKDNMNIKNYHMLE